MPASTTKYTIALLPGDGIGPEVCDEAVKVLHAVGKRFSINFSFKLGYVGGAGYEHKGKHLPEETIEICRNADSILFGSVGGPVDFPESERDKWNNAEKNSLLGLRKTFNLAINLRPCKVYPFLQHICPLKAERIADGVDILVVRELVSGIYFGEKEAGVDEARDVMYYHRDEIAKAIQFGVDAARLRKKKLTIVDKANVLETSKLWRRVAKEFESNNNDITFDYLYVDNAAMQLIVRPSQFDVIVTSNMFGDILSDIGSQLPGSLGLMPTASIGDLKPATGDSTSKGIMMFEPAGGSAPTLTGRNVANPMAQVLSAAWMLRYQFDMEEAALSIENAVDNVLNAGLVTGDLDPTGSVNHHATTSEVGDAIVMEVLNPGSYSSLKNNSNNKDNNIGSGKVSAQGYCKKGYYYKILNISALFGAGVIFGGAVMKYIYRNKK